MVTDNEKIEAAEEKKPRAEKSAKSKNDMTFEAAMQRLEAVVRALEDGKTTLDASMKLYEEGVSLVRICENKLEDARKRVKVLTDDEIKNAQG